MIKRKSSHQHQDIIAQRVNRALSQLSHTKALSCEQFYYTVYLLQSVVQHAKLLLSLYKIGKHVEPRRIRAINGKLFYYANTA
jgi:hypothetical protein